MSENGLEQAVSRFNRALERIGSATDGARAENRPADISDLSGELVQLREQRARLVEELEQVQAERARDADRRNDILRRLDDSIAELRRILGQ